MRLQSRLQHLLASKSKECKKKGANSHSYRQLASDPFRFPIPYPMSPPPATPIPFAPYQVLILDGYTHRKTSVSAPQRGKIDHTCSARVYHITVTSMNAGSAMASAAPLKTRSTTSSLKLCTAAWHISRIPLSAR
jgi:hypothetical protein